MENPVIIFGANNVGLQALDIFKNNNVIVYGFLDDDTSLHNSELNEVPVCGSTDDEGYTKLIGQKCEAFVATDDNSLKKSITKMLMDRRKTMPVNAIHAKAYVSDDATLGHGNLLAAGAVVQPLASVGNHCLIQANATIDAKATLADYVQIGPGANIGSEVQLGEGALIGMGATVVAGIKIGKNARVGAGSLVIADVPAGTTVFGNPAQKV
jgi:sugar O-acyltransferase (sialic acid O-acetyltransferase NeuD family)